jgi:hypothetical protein
VISILLLGFFLGVRHATDPVHVVAVASAMPASAEPQETTRVVCSAPLEREGAFHFRALTYLLALHSVSSMELPTP